MTNDTMRQKTILVIEDEMPLLLAIKKKLESNGFDVITARTAEQAWEYLHEPMHIDAVWLDHYLLGQETGLDFVGKIKHDEKIKDTPIFIVSNTISDEKVRTYLALGINKYYTKVNFLLSQVIQDIKMFLDASKIRDDQDEK